MFIHFSRMLFGTESRQMLNTCLMSTCGLPRLLRVSPPLTGFSGAHSMSSRELLTGEALESAVAELDGWEVVDGKLHKEYTFADFVQAFGFMSAAALCAERANHHPEWFNVYNRVRVDLATHDAGGITAFDIDLAREMERIAST